VTDVTGLGDLDNSTCKRFFDLLEAGYFRLGETVIKKITVIKFGVDDRGNNGGGCFDNRRIWREMRS